MTVTTSGQNHPTRDVSRAGRNGHGQFARTIADVERDYKAATLAGQGRTYQAIADELGYSDRKSAWQGVQRAWAETAPKVGLSEMRDEAEAKARTLEMKLLEIVDEPGPEVDRLGRPVVDQNGKVKPDRTAQIGAASAMLRLWERMAKMRGLDAPRRTHATVQATIESIPPEDLRRHIEQKRKALMAESGEADEFAYRRRLLLEALTALDAEEAQRRAIPGAVEPA